MQKIERELKHGDTIKCLDSLKILPVERSMKRQCSTFAKRFTCPFFQKGLEEWVCLSYEEDEGIRKKEKEDEQIH